MLGGRHRVAAFLSAFLWVVTILVGIFLYYTGRLNSYPVEIVYKEVCDAATEVCQKSPDSISLAVQLGRLDWVSIALALVGAGVGLLAILSFLYAKEKAEIEAKKTAKECVDSLTAELKEKAEKDLEETKKKFERELEKAKNDLLSDAWAEFESHINDVRECVGLDFGEEVDGASGDMIAVSVEDESNEKG